MRIFVTGGCGFIGSNFIINAINNNYEILNFDKLTYAANLENLKQFNKSQLYSFIKGDINDSGKIIKLLNEFNPNCIINFAAESHVDRSIDGPRDFIQTNILGTYELLQVTLDYYKSLSITKQNKFKFLHVSTDEVYGSLGESGLFSETSAYKPSSPYSASKASSDHLVNAWHLTYGLPIIITNCSNNYGPYQFPEKLIPLMIINCLKGLELPVYGNGKNIRDWLYVEDHCEALIMIMKKGKIGDTYNIGGGEEKTNIEIVEKICELLDSKQPSKNNKSYKKLINFVPDRAGHDYRYAINANKIKNDLGWVPKKSFEEALNYTIDWYLNNINWWEPIIEKKYNLKRLGVI